MTRKIVYPRIWKAYKQELSVICNVGSNRFKSKVLYKWFSDLYLSRWQLCTFIRLYSWKDVIISLLKSYGPFYFIWRDCNPKNENRIQEVISCPEVEVFPDTKHWMICQILRKPPKTVKYFFVLMVTMFFQCCSQMLLDVNPVFWHFQTPQKKTTTSFLLFCKHFEILS